MFVSKNFFNLIMGIFACAFYSVILAPFRRVQILLQMSEELNKEGILITPYSGIGNCIKRIIKPEGYRGLWKSMAICFLNSYCRAINAKFLKPKISDFHSNFYLLDLVFRVIEDLTVDLISHPFEYIEASISSDIAYGSLSKPRYHGFVDFIKKFKDARKSYKTLYTGFSILIVGQLLRKIVFDTNTLIFSQILGEESNFFLTDVLPTAYSILVSYPFENLRRRDMINGGEYGGNYGGNIVKGFKTIISEEGVLSLYGRVGKKAIFLIRFTIPCIILIVKALNFGKLNTSISYDGAK